MDSNKIQHGYEIVAWMDGMAIAKDELDEIVFCRIPEEFTEIGTVLFDEDAIPISVLSLETQKKIRTFLSIED